MAMEEEARSMIGRQQWQSLMPVPVPRVGLSYRGSFCSRRFQREQLLLSAGQVS
jgi:hypothetical protein